MQFQKVYTLRQVAFNSNVIPKVLETGTYKFVFNIYEKGSSDTITTADFLAKLY